MTQLVTLLLALVGSDEQLESVLEQQALGDVRAEVTASSPECVGTAAVRGFRVAPQNIYNLSGEADSGGRLKHYIYRLVVIYRLFRIFNRMFNFHFSTFG